MINHAKISKVKFDPSNKVVLTRAEDRYHTIFNGLTTLSPEINAQIDKLNPEEDYILVKPNCVVSHVANCATNVEAIKAFLDFIAPIWDGKVILAEGSGENTIEAFNAYNYIDLKNDFPKLEFLDLNYSDAIFVDIFDHNLKPIQIKISNTVAEAPLRVSIGPPKTHNDVIITLSIKNFAVGSILKEDKPKIHQGTRAINRNIAELFKYTFPHLAIIDGWQSMEGDGPVHGKMVDTKYSAISTDALAADVLVTELMGFNPVQVGYLNLLGAEKIKGVIQAIGLDPKLLQSHLKPHKTYLQQIDWT